MALCGKNSRNSLYNCAASVLLGAKTIAGRPSRAITLAMVKVLPEPVTPSKVWNTSPSRTPSTSLSMAAGWSPAGGYGRNSSNGEFGKVTNSPCFSSGMTSETTGMVFRFSQAA